MAERYGKYRAVVSDILDPEVRGRIKVKCPSLLSLSDSSWCEYCGSTSDFHLPALGDTVWVEFENGLVDKPVYSGSWYAKEQIPTTDTSGSTRVIQFNGNTITMSDHIELKSKDGTTISINGGSLTINGVAVALVTQLP